MSLTVTFQILAKNDRKSSFYKQLLRRLFSTNKIFLNPIIPGTIVGIMKEFFKKPSEDINGISIKFLSEHIFEVAQPLAFMFNLSL